MDNLAIIFLSVAVLTALAAAVAIRHEQRKTRTVMEALSKMLDAAMDGSFQEEQFDETLRSALETKLAHYLASSQVSARNLQSERDKIKSLIADISHQTKTPIANVLLYSQLLSEQELSTEGHQCVTALDVQAQKLRSLIEALIKISRLETGVLAMQTHPAPVSPAIQAALSQYSHKAAEKEITLSFDATDAEAVFDPKWTEEALCNLIDNAVKYTPRGGHITVSVQSYELFCCINVADTGIGVPEDERAQVFSRFYRGTAARESEGIGIGLYLVRQIAEGQRGYVRFTPQEDGGSCFSLFLPKA